MRREQPGLALGGLQSEGGKAPVLRESRRTPRKLEAAVKEKADEERAELNRKSPAARFC